MKKIIALSILIFASACAGPAKLTDIPVESFGERPPQETQPIIEEFIEFMLIDPGSAMYRRVGGPMQGYAQKALLMGGDVEYGWGECWMINSRNRFGGYVGWMPYYFVFRGDKIVGAADNPHLSSWNCFF